MSEVKIKLGRPRLNKKVFVKTIKLDENEVQFWDSKVIHEFLQGKGKNKQLLKDLYELMGNMKFEDEFIITPEVENLINEIDSQVRT